MPSGSVAVSAWSAVAPSFTVMFAGCASTGAWFVAVTLMVKLRVAVVPFADAVTDAAKLPEVPSVGARWMFPSRLFPDWATGVTVMNPGPEDVKEMASPSASLA